MKTDSDGHRVRKAKDFDWTDWNFLEDSSYYTGLDFRHLWPGVGRLVQSLQGLQASLESCQRLVIENTKGCPPAYDLSRRNVRIKPDEVRDSALGRVFSIRYPGWTGGAEDEIRKIVLLTEERDFFVYTFFSKHFYDDDTLNDALLRLKKDIFIAEKMDERYELFEMDELYLDDTSEKM